jgi:hypothetical protein
MRDPFAPIKIVSITDPSVVFENEAAREQYRVSRDSALWKTRSPGTPALFTVTPCSAEAAMKIDAMTLDVRRLIAFRASVHRVDLPSGEVLEAKTYESGGYGTLADEAWIATVAAKVGPRRVLEIGEAAHRLSMLDDIDPLLQPPGQPPQS